MSALSAPSRRSMLVAAVALAAPAASAGEYSALDELIADYKWAKQASDAAWEAAELLGAEIDLPLPVIRHGKRRIQDPETGTVSWGQWEFSFDFEIERHFDPIIAAWETNRLQKPFVEKMKITRDQLLCDLRAQEAVREALTVSSGLRAAQDAFDHAYEQQDKLREQIIAYRPSAIAEVAVKNAFLLQLMQSGWRPSPDDLAIIFSA